MNRAATATISRDYRVVPRPPAPRALRAALEGLFTCAGRRIAGVVTRPMAYASSFTIDEVDVRFEDDRTVRLVCKHLGDRGILPEARGIKPHFLRDPLREIAVYELILEPAAVGAPKYYGRRIEPGRGRYWLFLERIVGSPLSEIGDFDVWRRAATFLARMHTDRELRARAHSSEDRTPLLRYDAAFHRRWMRRALQFQIHRKPADSSRRARLTWLASRYDAIVEEVEALPTTFLHGEFYASNVLVDGRVGSARVRPLDWELAGVGSPLMDLAALTAGWQEEPRRELALDYYAEIPPGDRCWLPFDAFMRALDCCRVQLAVRCLGWARRWSPPKTHAQDWLAEAVHVTERISR